MLNPIIIMLKSRTCIKRRVYVYTLNFTSIPLFQCLQCKKIVTMNKHVVEDVFVTMPHVCMIRLFRIFNQHPWLKPWPLLFPDPCQFKFLLSVRHNSLLSYDTGRFLACG